jgi:AAA ATPase domain
VEPSAKRWIDCSARFVQVGVRRWSCAGSPASGKTALLEYAVERAAGCRVVRASGVESEIELAFGALHQLCAALLDWRDALPEPQGDALAIAFGPKVGTPPDRLFVGLAVLGLLSEAAADRPLLCVVDDAQWLDRESAQALAFATRRLMADSVGVILAARAAGEDGALAGLPELRVEGLGDADAKALLASTLHVPIDERVRDGFSPRRAGTRWRCWSSRAV